MYLPTLNELYTALEKDQLDLENDSIHSFLHPQSNQVVTWTSEILLKNHAHYMNQINTHFSDICYWT